MATLLSQLVRQLVNTMREKPIRSSAWLFGGLVVAVVMFTLADILPAPYDF